MRRQLNKITGNRVLRGSVFAFVFVLIFSSLFFSCSKEDNTIPSYRTDLLCAAGDGDSLVTRLLLDDGQTLKVTQRIKAPEPNSTLRCYSSYAVSDDGTIATVYEIRRITCFAPSPADSCTIHDQSPLKVQSVWKSGSYVNLSLAPLVNQDGEYKYDLRLDSVVSRTMYVSFLFQRDSSSLEAYTQKFYHSIPLQQSLYSQPFDSLILSINTYDGMKSYAFRR